MSQVRVVISDPESGEVLENLMVSTYDANQTVTAAAVRNELEMVFETEEAE